MIIQTPMTTIFIMMTMKKTIVMRTKTIEIRKKMKKRKIKRKTKKTAIRTGIVETYSQTMNTFQWHFIIGNENYLE